MKIVIPKIAFLGIDVSKKDFKASLKIGGKHVQNSFDNSVSGFKKCRNWLDQFAPSNQIHGCLEATGIHHLALAIELSEHLKAVSVVNPRCTKAFADSQLRRSKSDSADARSIADFCEAMKPQVWVVPTQKELEIKELARREQGLTEMISAEKNRLQDAIFQSLQQSIARNIKSLQKEKEEVLKQLAAVIEADPVLRTRMELIDSIPGVGKATALQMVAELGNIDWFEKARDLAAYAGVTPRHRQSGSSLNSRGGISKIGSSRLRGHLYMPALVAIRRNPIMKAFAERLAGYGKSKKEIIVAVMRKLLHCIFGILKSEQPFNSNISCSI
jgi:transposase